MPRELNATLKVRLKGKPQADERDLKNAVLRAVSQLHATLRSSAVVAEFEVTKVDEQIS